MSFTNAYATPAANDPAALRTAESRLAAEARLLLGDAGATLTADVAIGEALAELLKAARESRVIEGGARVLAPGTVQFAYGASLAFEYQPPGQALEVRPVLALNGSGQTQLNAGGNPLAIVNPAFAQTAGQALLGYLTVYLYGANAPTNLGRIPVYAFG